MCREGGGVRVVREGGVVDCKERVMIIVSSSSSSISISISISSSRSSSSSDSSRSRSSGICGSSSSSSRSSRSSRSSSVYSTSVVGEDASVDASHVVGLQHPQHPHQHAQTGATLGAPGRTPTDGIGGGGGGGRQRGL